MHHSSQVAVAGRNLGAGGEVHFAPRGAPPPRWRRPRSPGRGRNRRRWRPGREFQPSRRHQESATEKKPKRRLGVAARLRAGPCGHRPEASRARNRSEETARSAAGTAGIPPRRTGHRRRPPPLLLPLTSQPLTVFLSLPPGLRPRPPLHLRLTLSLQTCSCERTQAASEDAEAAGGGVRAVCGVRAPACVQARCALREIGRAHV